MQNLSKLLVCSLSILGWIFYPTLVQAATSVTVKNAIKVPISLDFNLPGCFDKGKVTLSPQGTVTANYYVEKIACENTIGGPPVSRWIKIGDGPRIELDVNLAFWKLVGQPYIFISNNRLYFTVEANANDITICPKDGCK